MPEPTPNEDEAVEARFFDPNALPQPLHGPTAYALELLEAFYVQGTFQVR